MILSNRLNRLLLAIIPTSVAFTAVSSFSVALSSSSSSSSPSPRKSFFSSLKMSSAASSSEPSSSSSTKATASDTSRRCGIDYPELVVFDADACLWDQEMYQMPAIPTSTDVVMGDLNGMGQGVIATKSGPYEIRLYPGSLLALQQHALGKKYPGMRICIASSADTPFAEKICRANLKLLEVLPAAAAGGEDCKQKLTIWDLLMRDWNGQDVNQIGRQPPNLSSNKARSHFPNLHQVTGIRYDKMLFFDDCNWGDHCGMVTAACKEPDTGKGPAILRTPNGLGVQEWYDGLAAYKKHHAAT